MALVKTELGQQVLKDRSVALTPRQRALLILCDGRRGERDVLAATVSTGVTRDDLVQLRVLGLVVDGLRGDPAEEPAAAPAPAAASASSARATTPAAAVDGERYLQAYRTATALAAGLGLKGFRLSMAIEAASSYDDLVALAPRIREAVGADKFAPLEALLRAR